MRAPMKSNMGFIAPEAILKPTPSVKDVIRDPQPTTPPPAKTGITVAPAQPQTPAAVQTTAPTPPQTPANNPASAPAQTVTGTVPDTTPLPQKTPVDKLNEKQYSELFLQKWNEMIDIVFDKVPTLQAPIKHYTPEIKDFVIHIALKNDFQQDDFAAKKNEVLQYIRNNFDERINDVETTMAKEDDVQKYILDDDDKITELKQQNPDLGDFIKTLNLRIKG